MSYRAMPGRGGAFSRAQFSGKGLDGARHTVRVLLVDRYPGVQGHPYGGLPLHQGQAGTIIGPFSYGGRRRYYSSTCVLVCTPAAYFYFTPSHDIWARLSSLLKPPVAKWVGVFLVYPQELPGMNVPFPRECRRRRRRYPPPPNLSYSPDLLLTWKYFSTHFRKGGGFNRQTDAELLQVSSER